MNQGVWSPIRVFLYVLMIIFFISTMMFLLGVSMLNQYVSQANTVITRSSGLTKNSYNQLNELSEKGYWDMYHVSLKPSLSSESDNDRHGDLHNNASDNYSNTPVGYGDKGHYYIYANVPYGFARKAMNNWNHGFKETVIGSSRNQQ